MSSDNLAFDLLIFFLRKIISQCWDGSGDWNPSLSLQWRHNDRDGISIHQPPDCLLNGLFRCRSKKTSKLCVIGLCAGNSPITSEFPHKGPVMWKCFHLMTSSCGKSIRKYTPIHQWWFQYFGNKFTKVQFHLLNIFIIESSISLNDIL